MSAEIFKAENIFTQHDVENKQLKEENEKLRKEEREELRNEKENGNENENERLKTNNVVKDANTKELIEKPREIKSPKEHKNPTDYCPKWFDKNTFKNTLAIIDSNEFRYKNNIGEFKYIDMKSLVNNIKNNTISEISAKKVLNTLNELKIVGIKKQKNKK